jgi:YidC/Oxa1 family membrane protein insertase
LTNQRNLLFAVVLSALLLLGWDAAVGYLYPQPADTAAVEGIADTPAEMAAVSGAVSGTTASGSGLAPGVAGAEPVTLDSALASGNRVRIDSPLLAGSINLRGAVIDDIVLKEYRETTEEDSPPVRLFAPAGTPVQHFAEFGFLANGQRVPADALWQADGEVLAPGSPVVLTHQGDNGLTYTITLTIDDQYMISAEQRVANRGAGAAVVQPFALIARTSRTASEDFFIAHSGPMGVFGGSANYDFGYDDLPLGDVTTPEGDAEWLGFTDIYWLSALVPGAGNTEASFRALGGDLFRADVIQAPITLPSGRAITATNRLFVGAKESAILDSYEDAGIERFGLAIDWGWFRWFEKPLLWLLRQLYELAGNFGVAIILLTVVVRGVMFPVAQKQFSSMAGMKAIQPRMKEVQEKHKDDRVKQQQEMQKLFKDEGVNPLAGCLPLIIQIPIFFALYKVLYLAIEMRHRPFLWIDDLSAPDPAVILNGFGLLPFDPPGFLAIGVLAVLLGLTMWMTFQLNPVSDPMQRQIFNIMPWVLMFVMAPFAAGLLIYWNTSNILTLAQQKYLYSKHPQLSAAAEAERAEKDAQKAASKTGANS